jgi:L-threonylcarbamoyladenylate synthase
MKIITFLGKDGGKKCQTEVLTSLKKGAVIALPTDTIYGLSCLANNAKAVKKIKEMKGKSVNRALIILVSSIAMLKKYVILSKEKETDLHKYFGPKTRPTTVILKHKSLLPKEVSGAFDTLAIRLPKSVFLIKIIRRARMPLISTSLNLSGQINVSDPNLVNNYFKNNPDLLVDAGICKNKKASRLIDLSQNGKAIILRK